jgi:hypothetical protein
MTQDSKLMWENLHTKHEMKQREMRGEILELKISLV